jgi:hypothetical protein
MRKINTYIDFINESNKLPRIQYLLNLLESHFKPSDKNNCAIEHIIKKNDKNYNTIYLYSKNYTYDSLESIIFGYKNHKYKVNVLYLFYDFANLSELKVFLNGSLAKIYYDRLLKRVKSDTRFFSMNKIVVIDNDSYSKFIYNSVLLNKKYFEKQYSIWYNEYLTDEYKDKIEVLRNANNFDLI